MCRRYNALPSELLRSGDMIDFMIADVGVGWEQYAEDCRKHGIDPKIGRYGNMSQEELKAMMERAQNSGKN